MSDELEALRKKKMMEMQRQLYEAEKEEAVKQEYERQKEAILRVILTSEARSRLANLKIVRPQLAESVELQLIQLAQAGQIKSPLTDEQLKSILRRLTSKKHETKIIFK